MRIRYHYTLPLPLLAIFSVLLLLLGACRDPEITTYAAPKEPAPAAAAMPAGHPPRQGMSAPAQMQMPPSADMAVGSDPITWTAPAAWTAKASGQMVKASYTVPAAPDAKEALATVSSFPGDVGGTFNNVNRWRGQIGLAPIAEKDLAASTTAVENGALRFTVVDFTNDANGTRMLGAILSLRDETYFFKMTGPTATVAAQKQAFLDLLQTVKLQQVQHQQ